ncbi:MAG TPA: hypothetical protein DCG75_12270 [Bacteroidales bacterium]|nr:hypothetical protein [Bacteroidales bacterium]
MQDEYDFNKLDDEMEITAGFLAPVAYGSLNLQDIISEFDSSSFISTDADGLLLITYEDSLFSYIADDLLNIPSQDFIEFFIESDFTILPGFPGWNTGDTLTILRSQKFPFTFSQGEKLDSMILDQGNMVFNVTSEFQHTGNIVITCPNIRLDNVPFERTILIDDASGGFSFNSSFPLDGYTIYLNDSIGTDTMFLPVNFKVELISSGDAITAGEEIAVTATIENMNFDAIFGYIGDYELLTQTGEVDLGFFENTLDGYIYFENPQINFNIKNSYGVPAAVTISRFVGFKNDIDSIQMIFDSSIDTFGYAYPSLADYIANDIYKDTTISINGTNSNVSDFLSFLPSKLEYSLGAKSNPEGPTGSYNFVSDDSKIDVGFEFILPLWFKADNFALEDTIDLDLMDIDQDANFIEKVNILLEVSNGLPLEIDFQVYFLDSLYNPVDSLFDDASRPIIRSGITDPLTGEVIAPGINKSFVEYTKDDIANLNTVRYGIIRAGLKTPSDASGDQFSVKFFTDYSVDFNLSVGVDVKANSNDF